MALDPLSALSLASNVVQFVDFSWKLLYGAHAIYRSGCSGENKDLASIATSAKHLSDSIIISSSCPPSMKDVARECKAAADDLHLALQRLVVEGKKTKWKSFTVALKEVWQASKIKGFVERLSRIQQGLVAHIQETVLESQSKLSQTIVKLEDSNRELGLYHTKALQNLRQTIITSTTELEERHQSQLQSFVRIIQDITADSFNQFSDMSTVLSSMSTSIKQLDQKCREATTVQKVLKSLYFNTIRSRLGGIEEAHNHTFDWIFEPKIPQSENAISQQINFVEWLRDKDNIFWVRGKAGSGKSTLMKFLCNHKETVRYLSMWAGDKKLVIAKFFFWNAGSGLQKSQEGFLRSILYEIIKSCPDVASQVEAKLDELSVLDDSAPWTLASLKRMCHELIVRDQSKKFCLFIDGLDEYKGDNGDLIETMHGLSSKPNIKICLSSRPWTEFIDAYSQDPDWMIKLEDLTAEDMRRFVNDHLLKSSQFQQLINEDDGYSDLVAEVVRKSQGVFLWVFLAVRSLLEGARYCDDLVDMKARLDALPDDLHTFYSLILRDIPKVYRSRTAQAFKIAMVADGSLPLMVYSFIDDATTNPKFPLNHTASRMEAVQVLSRFKKMQRRLDGRSKGLLEAVGAGIYRAGVSELVVTYLHATVQEFLSTSSEIQEMFNKELPKDFDANLLLCRAYLAEIKMLPTMGKRYYRSEDDLESSTKLQAGILDHLLYYARNARASSGHADVLQALLEDLEAFLLSCGFFSLRYDVPDRKSCFLLLAAQYGLADFVDRHLNTVKGLKSGNLYKQRTQLALLYATTLPERSRDRNGIELSPKVVECLLRHGADPMRPKFKPICDQFVSFVEDLVGRSRWGSKGPMSEDDKTAIKSVWSLLCEHGATKNGTIRNDVLAILEGEAHNGNQNYYWGRQHFFRSRKISSGRVSRKTYYRQDGNSTRSETFDSIDSLPISAWSWLVRFLVILVFTQPPETFLLWLIYI